jgi:hypothetical protein
MGISLSTSSDNFAMLSETDGSQCEVRLLIVLIAIPLFVASCINLTIIARLQEHPSVFLYLFLPLCWEGCL